MQGVSRNGLAFCGWKHPCDFPDQSVCGCIADFAVRPGDEWDVWWRWKNTFDHLDIGRDMHPAQQRDTKSGAQCRLDFGRARVIQNLIKAIADAIGALSRYARQVIRLAGLPLATAPLSPRFARSPVRYWQ